MKKIFLFIALCSGVLVMNAQKLISEGTITYEIYANTETNPTTLGNIINGASSTLTIKGKALKTSLVNVLGKDETIIDGKSDLIYILKNYSSQKLMITANKEEWAEINKDYNNLTFAEQKGTTTILGYNCKKTVAKLQNNKVLTVYYTPDLVLNNALAFGFSKYIKGLPLQFSISSSKTTLTYKVKEINENPVKTSEFDLPKSDYSVMTYTESKKQNEN